MAHCTCTTTTHGKPCGNLAQKAADADGLCFPCFAVGHVVDDSKCPEYCGHPGKCAEDSAAISAMERQCELAAERYYEGGWDTTGAYSYDPAERYL